MALKKTGTVAQFEGEDEASNVIEGESATTTVTEEVSPKVEDAQPQVETPNKVEPKQETAVAVAPAKALSVVAGAGKFKHTLVAQQNAINPQELDFDTFPRVTCGLDGFAYEDDSVVGKRIRIQVLSWNERFIVTAGEDTDEANAKVKFSLDGVHIDGDENLGMLVTDYIETLKAEGYEKAALKRYNTIYGLLEAASETDKSPWVEVPEDDRNIIAIQVSPRSVSQFTGYRIQQGLKVSMGHCAESDKLVMTQVKVSGSKKSYAGIRFSAK